MPVTKTAKRALRGSKRKQKINSIIAKKLEIAVKLARKEKSKEKIIRAISSLDRAAKKRVIHKNKAARIKSSLAKTLLNKKGVKRATKSKNKTKASKKK